MKMKLLAAAAAAALGWIGTAQAETVIYNTGDANTATIALGVNDLGELNTSLPINNITVNGGATGLALKFPDGNWYDSTSPGCLCEGWGVSVNGTTSGSANQDDGVVNLTTGALTAVTGSTVTTTASLTSLPGLTVTHAFAPATNSPGALFDATVTITNDTGAAVNDLKYVRVMDWDVPPTEFTEFVTIAGTGTTTLLERSHDNGFEVADPLAADTPLDAATADTDFTDNGPADHGAYFRFNFGTLADGASYTFHIFYGAAASEAEAVAAMAAESVELYSLGQSADVGGVGGPATGTPATFIFGFSGVGGTAIGNAVPEPASLSLVGLALLGIGGLRRRRAN